MGNDSNRKNDPRFRAPSRPEDLDDSEEITLTNLNRAGDPVDDLFDSLQHVKEKEQTGTTPTPTHHLTQESANPLSELFSSQTLSIFSVLALLGLTSFITYNLFSSIKTSDRTPAQEEEEEEAGARPSASAGKPEHKPSHNSAPHVATPISSAIRPNSTHHKLPSIPKISKERGRPAPPVDTGDPAWSDTDNNNNNENEEIYTQDDRDSASDHDRDREPSSGRKKSKAPVLDSELPGDNPDYGDESNSGSNEDSYNEDHSDSGSALDGGAPID